MKSILHGALAILALVAALFLVGLLYWFFVCACDRDIGKPDDGIGVVGPEVREESKGGAIDPKRTEGAPYPPVEPVIESTFIPNEEHINFPPIPVGPLRGDIEPKNPAIKIAAKDEEPSQELDFDDYAEVDDVLPNIGSLGEVSVAENGETIIMTGNTWMAFSEDAGGTFTYINPTTVFPQDDGGLCCDQIVLYVPQYDLFVWLMQYRSAKGGDGTNDNRIRVAVESTEGVRSSNGTAWTYWDFPSNVFSALGSLDYNDMTASRNPSTGRA